MAGPALRRTLNLASWTPSRTNPGATNAGFLHSSLAGKYFQRQQGVMPVCFALEP